MSTKPLYCLMPLASLLIGAGLAWFIHLFVNVDLPPPVAELAVRFFSLIVGVTFWGLSFALMQKRMYCGGIEAFTEDTRIYYIAGIFLAIALLIIAGVSLAAGNLVLYFAVVIFLAALFTGEIGWGKAFWLIGKDDSTA